ncbi:hypothetical protein HNO51_08065 [Billgrantia sulfidoxydans]|uniref:Uncharacterized protein n=1 Tax=Billgrantia sulfidoxydans TaxID=2733484 RepID=A0ABX7W4L3_9GAMM|nr:hypothetical protein [Halomonas sulfidoxydans]QTP54645.1 hypothetical protein HNO51_08065 [Halomonas sulfidoxydans]
MKLKIVTLGIAVASVLSMPTMAAMGGSAPQELPVLDRGISSTQILANGHPKRFQINIDQPTTLRVTSEQFPGVSGSGVRIMATLYDDSGRRVAEASSPRGHFQLSRQLQPGAYEVEVSGWSYTQNADNLSNRYQLHVAY